MNWIVGNWFELARYLIRSSTRPQNLPIFGFRPSSFKFQFLFSSWKHCPHGFLLILAEIKESRDTMPTAPYFSAILTTSPHQEKAHTQNKMGNPTESNSAIQKPDT